MNLKELINIEEKSTKDFAAKSSSNLLKKRRNTEVDGITLDGDEVEYRLPFQRDRDRIIHSRAFRRLMHKTQIFNANKGDHYRNRLTHTLEVSQIARSISKNLGLNEELTEAIALGHDLGHTPFGHIGERTLHLLISGKIEDELNLNKSNHGGFKHNFQSLQIIDNIEKRTNKYKGLNLTLAVREGILKHTGAKIKIPKKNRSIVTNEKDNVEYNSLDLTDINIDKPSFTLEGQVVAISDEIAQCTHDLEDGIRAKIIRVADIKEDELIKLVCEKYKIKLNEKLETVDIRNSLIRIMIGFLINDVCDTTEKNLKEKYNNEYPEFKNINDVFTEEVVKFSEKITEKHDNLYKLITQLVIASQQVTQSDLKAEFIINKLFHGYFKHPQQLPDYILSRFYEKKGKKFNRIEIENNIENLQEDGQFIRLICDHIGSMTDQYAAREYKKLYEPEYY